MSLIEFVPLFILWESLASVSALPFKSDRTQQSVLSLLGVSLLVGSCTATILCLVKGPLKLIISP